MAHKRQDSTQSGLDGHSADTLEQRPEKGLPSAMSSARRPEKRPVPIAVTDVSAKQLGQARSSVASSYGAPEYAAVARRALRPPKSTADCAKSAGMRAPAHALDLVREQVAALRISVVGDDKTRRGSRAGVEHLQQLKRLAARRRAKVKNLRARAPLRSARPCRPGQPSRGKSKAGEQGDPTRTRGGPACTASEPVGSLPASRAWHECMSTARACANG